MPAHKEKNESHTALTFDSSGRFEFEITHPFHPDRGQPLQLVQMRVDGGEPWLWYVDREGKPRRVKRSFTDRAEPDEFWRQAAGRCAFHLQDLVRLLGVVERLQRRGATRGRS